jgi:citrate synthase
VLTQTEESDVSDFVTAKEAAAILGVSVSTLYVYVGRKNIRSRPVPGSRERRYFRADLDRELNRRHGREADTVSPTVKSAITQVDADGNYFYRGQNALTLANTFTLEQTAAHLWGFEYDDLFPADLPKSTRDFEAISKVVARRHSVDRATTLLHLLEEANPKSFDVSPIGIARSGIDVVRWLTAILFRLPKPSAEPAHIVVGAALNLDAQRTDLIRRLLVLAADHGVEVRASAVRAAAKAGVTPWRTVTAGLLITLSHRSGSRDFATIYHLLNEILTAADPTEPVIRRLRRGEDVPGFGKPDYADRDARAAALREGIHRAFPDEDTKKLDTVFAIMKDIGDQEPSFLLLRAFLSRKIGVDISDPLFNLARSVGWIAHSIEQIAQDDIGRR